jgi:BirA family biotin operon repressor/biotin-[acetyl-CoA-carboxylase] ligase
MDRIKDILSFLKESNHHVSGDLMSSRLSISRTAVWKYINQLEHLGYGIDKLKGKGYRLAKIPDKLYPWEIQDHLNTAFIGKKIIYRDTVGSTNTSAFKLAVDGEPEGTCVVAESQATGKGRLNRRWFSPAGKNICISVILRPVVHPSRVYPITFLSSLAVHDTIEALLGTRPSLKWPNDVLIAGKKVCGTLLELSTEADMVRFVVVGIGFDINMKKADMDPEIKDKATSLFLETKKHFERTRVCGILLTNLEKYYALFRDFGAERICSLWEETAAIKGKHLEIVQMNERFEGTAEGVDRDGGILLNVNGRVTKIIAGDVSF